jgi:hypothetical protein
MGKIETVVTHGYPASTEAEIAEAEELSSWHQYLAYHWDGSDSRNELAQFYIAERLASEASMDMVDDDLYSRLHRVVDEDEDEDNWSVGTKEEQ